MTTEPGGFFRRAERRPTGAGLAYARIVTHYFVHDGFLEDGVLLREVGALAGIPACSSTAGSTSRARSRTRGS